MNLDRTVKLVGVPIKIVRDAIREMDRHGSNEHGWTVETLGAYLKISATHAELVCEALRAQGILERAPQPDMRRHSRGMYYRLGRIGTRFTNASMLKRIDRPRVDTLLADLLRRVNEINANGDLCCFVNELRVFGSVADVKAESFSDVDVGYVLERRKRPAQYKEWTAWSIARAKQSGRQGLQYLEELFYGETEVKRALKSRSPYISLHSLDDVVGIGAQSVRLYLAPEGAIEADDGCMSGEALSQAKMKAAIDNAAKRDKSKQGKKTSTQTALADGPARERMVLAVRSLAFDVLRTIDEATPLDVLERSIELAHERIQAYRQEGEAEHVSNVLHKALSIDAIEQEDVNKNERFVFSGDRERWEHDGTSAKRAAERGMQSAVIAQLKCKILGREDADASIGMARQFAAYRNAEYDAWKYREEHGYDWYGPERLYDRAVVTLRRIASGENEKLDKQALKTLSDNDFIKTFRKTRWRLTAKGELAIKYHDERDAWNKQRNEIGTDKSAL